jgi:hypothetical protein
MTAVGGSSRIRDPQRRKSGALKTPMQQKVAHAPTPNSTPMQEGDMRRSDDLAGHNDDTADSGALAGASPATATSAGAAAAVASPAAQTPGSLKVQVKMGSPPAASPSKVCRLDGLGRFNLSCMCFHSLMCLKVMQPLSAQHGACSQM